MKFKLRNLFIIMDDDDMKLLVIKVEMKKQNGFCAVERKYQIGTEKMKKPMAITANNKKSNSRK